MQRVPVRAFVAQPTIREEGGQKTGHSRPGYATLTVEVFRATRRDTAQDKRDAIHLAKEVGPASAACRLSLPPWHAHVLGPQGPQGPPTGWGVAADAGACG